MNMNKLLEKISWKLHRVNFKIKLFTFKYDGGNSSCGFKVLSVVNRLKESSLLSWSFRLPNKTNVKVFVTDHWDFLFLRNYLYKKYERLIEKELWTRRGLTKNENLARRLLSKLF